jgi:hypothetical protein
MKVVGQSVAQTKKGVKKTKKQKTHQSLVEKDLKNQLEDLQYVVRMVFRDMYSMTSRRKW